MHYKTDYNVNKVCIGDNTIIEMNVGNGWTITDVWIDHDLPIEVIDCVKVKICKCDTYHQEHCDSCNVKTEPQTERNDDE